MLDTRSLQADQAPPAEAEAGRRAARCLPSALRSRTEASLSSAHSAADAPTEQNAAAAGPGPVGIRRTLFCGSQRRWSALKGLSESSIFAAPQTAAGTGQTEAPQVSTNIALLLMSSLFFSS
ncbi:hypothetical protein AMECASPLE_019351 [Ameca splendens]|uniref:Uncharacterized protein n=1 Tax=Ameca splendens TaxID=208324 RepID=A0ABV0YPW3_9TELE